MEIIQLFFPPIDNVTVTDHNFGTIQDITIIGKACPF